MMSKNIVEPERPQTAIWRRVACWVSKATLAQAHACSRSPTPTPTHTHSPHTQKYVRLTTFLRQQWFRQRASLLHYTYIAYIVLKEFDSPLINLSQKLEGEHSLITEMYENVRAFRSQKPSKSASPCSLSTLFILNVLKNLPIPVCGYRRFSRKSLGLKIFIFICFAFRVRN